MQKVKKIQAPFKTMLSTVGDPKSSKRKYENTSKIEFFPRLAQNLKIMLPPARGLTFRGFSLSKILRFSHPFLMIASSRP